MGFRIARTVEFAASHQLTKFPAEHKCHRLHGHNYKVVVEMAAPTLDEQGVVVDYSVIKELIHGRYDHRNLNDFPEFDGNPTAELLAAAIWERLDEFLRREVNLTANAEDWVLCTRVRVAETEDSWAEFTP